MRVNSISSSIGFHGTSNQNKKGIINRHSMISETGYAAFGGALVSTFSGVRGNKTVHKIAAMVALAAATAHIVLLKTIHGSKPANK